MCNKIKVRQKEDCLILDIYSEKFSVDDFDYVYNVINKSRLSKTILLNLKDITHFDDNVAGYLREVFKKNDLDIRVFGLSPILSSIFYLLKLDMLFQLYSDENDALTNKNPMVKRRLFAI